MEICLEATFSTQRRRNCSPHVECGLALVMVAAEARLHVAAQPAARTLDWCRRPSRKTTDSSRTQQQDAADSRLSTGCVRKTKKELTTRDHALQEIGGLASVWYIPFARNQFEQFRGFWKNSQIRIRFSSSRSFLKNDSNFWCVQSSITCNETVHVHMLWLCALAQFHFECCGVLDNS